MASSLLGPVAEIETTEDISQHLNSTIRALAKGLGMASPEILTGMWAKHNLQQASDTSSSFNVPKPSPDWC